MVWSNYIKELLSPNQRQAILANGPLQVIYNSPSGGAIRDDALFDNADYDAIAQGLTLAEKNLGLALPASEWKDAGWWGVSLNNRSGPAIAAAYAWPVSLFSSDGKLLGEAKWVTVQTLCNGPNRLFYGTEIGTVTGGFLVSEHISGDISALEQAVAQVYFPNSSPTMTLITISITSSLNPSTYGQSVAFTATVSPLSCSTPIPAGTMTFSDGTTTLGTGTLNSSGVATFSTSSLAVGNHTITAVYSGAIKS
jgi:hypothetical protein